MSCKRKVIDTLRVVGDSPTEFKISFLLTLVTLLVQLLGTATSEWLVTSQASQGLFHYCQDSGHGHCCALLDDYPGSTNASLPVFIQFTRAFESIGVALILVTLVICTVMINRSGVSRFLQKEVRANMAFSLASFSATVLGVIIYGAEYKHDASMQQMSPSWSFAFCALAACLSFTNIAVLFVYDP